MKTTIITQEEERGEAPISSMFKLNIAALSCKRNRYLNWLNDPHGAIIRQISVIFIFRYQFSLDDVPASLLTKYFHLSLPRAHCLGWALNPFSVGPTPTYSAFAVFPWRTLLIYDCSMIVVYWTRKTGEHSGMVDQSISLYYDLFFSKLS